MNTKRYWLRGGLIMVIVFLVVIALAEVEDNMQLQMGFTWLASAMSAFGIKVTSLMSASEHGYTTGRTDVINIVINSIVWFAVGSFLGSLYRK